jgi:hypothetical protein
MRMNEPKDRLVIAGFSSRTGRRYFTTSVARPNPTPLEVTGARVTGHNCSDLVIDPSQTEGTSDRAREVEAVLSGSGHVLWELTFRANHATGGHLADRAPPKRFCA